MRYPASEKLEIIRLVENSHLSARRTLQKLCIPRSTFNRWYDRFLAGGIDALEDRRPRPNRVWNRIPAETRDEIIELALNEPQWPLREIMNAIFYVMRGGIGWRLLPSDFPPRSTVFRWFCRFRDECLFEKINHRLLMKDRQRCGRGASPTASIIDSQTVKTCESGGPRGYDAGKKIKGRKRHALVDIDGRALVLFPHPASIQDSDGAGPILQASRRPFPFIRKVFADAGYQGPRVAEATSIAVEIVKRKPDQVGFAVQPRRWVVERFFAWISRNRRLWKDAEATIESATAFLYAAAVMILVRRIARHS